MARFFEKNELVLIMLIILLLDFNGFCDTVIPHVLFKDQQTWGSFVVVFIMLIVDVFIYKNTVNSIPFDIIDFSNNKDHGVKTCEQEVKDKTEVYMKKIKDMDNVCSRTVNKGSVILKNIILYSIIAIIVIFSIACISFSESDVIDTRQNRMMRCVPLVLLLCSIFGLST